MVQGGSKPLSICRWPGTPAPFLHFQQIFHRLTVFSQMESYYILDAAKRWAHSVLTNCEVSVIGNSASAMRRFWSRRGAMLPWQEIKAWGLNRTCQGPAFHGRIERRRLGLFAPPAGMMTIKTSGRLTVALRKSPQNPRWSIPVSSQHNPTCVPTGRMQAWLLPHIVG